MIAITRPIVLAGALGALACLAACNPGGRSKAEIETIVREYLVENPEVIEEALVALTEKEKAAREAAAKAAIEEHKADLYANPADFSIGPASAPVTVVEFFDYRCGYCKKTVEPVRALPEQYDGKVRVVFKELPIFGGVSESAALAALAAGKQGKYLEMHLAFMALKSNDDLTEAAIDRIAKANGVNVQKMRADMNAPDVRKHLSDTMTLGQLLAVDGTPGFFVGTTHIIGADLDALNAAITKELES